MGSGVDVVRWGGGRLRVGPWRGDRRTAYLAPVGDSPGPSPDAVRRTVADLANRGYEQAFTAALGPLEAQGFLLAGFEVHERLHLLVRDLDDLPPAPPAAIRRARRRDHPAVLAVDALAFSPFWQLDEDGLQEALDATPTSRFRVATDPDDPRRIAGYAVTGRAGRRGFLQRLAVDPRLEGRGIGRALVLDGLAWLRRRGADRVVVNTQEANERALRLYERLGFRRQDTGLAVLRTTL